MAIAYLVSRFPKASETFVSRELLTLQKLGLELRPFAFDPPGRDEATQLDPITRQLIDRVEYLSPARILRHALGSWRRTLAGWRENAAMQKAATCKSNPQLRLLRVGALARRLQADRMVHLHAHWPYATEVAYQVHRLTGIPFSVSIHAHEVEHDAGHFPKVFQALSFATFCNRAAMERLLSKLPEEARKRSHLVYHGVDLDRFSSRPFPALEGPLRVVSAGRLAPSKGFDRLVRACAAYHAGGGRVELTILGQGALKNELRTLASERGFSDHLHLPGWRPHDQVARQLEDSHLFVLMANTDFNDGLPNVVLEAMASGRPVIVSPLPAAREAITEGREGFVLESATDEAGLVKRLEQVAANLAQLPAMGQAARQRVETTFDGTIHGRKLKALFEHQLRKRRSAVAPA